MNELISSAIGLIIVVGIPLWVYTKFIKKKSGRWW